MAYLRVKDEDNRFLSPIRSVFSKKSPERRKKASVAQVRKITAVASSTMDRALPAGDVSLKDKNVSIEKSDSSSAALLLPIGALLAVAGVLYYFQKNNQTSASDSKISSNQNHQEEVIDKDLILKTPVQKNEPAVQYEEIKPDFIPKVEVTEAECQQLCISIADAFASDSKDMIALETNADRVAACEALLQDRFCADDENS